MGERRGFTMNDNTAQFVCDLNVRRFAEKLRSERDPDMRVSLKKLLIEEEDKFGRKVAILTAISPKVVLELHHREPLLKDLEPTATTFEWRKEHWIT
jgi:hypothetical protein